ncbi:TIGR00341 family protein [Cryobacterium sp. N22]|uniref:TIGR00341 family protein n=1 Tax=Cryobacterium sp. N22 TaxID=2048290 RepID=UPI0018ED08C0|nr:TIGR00341 family protein [Cryobacterium sp. N22]
MADRFNTTESMRDSVFFDGPASSARYSRFWMLLVLASIIASAGIVGDSTATVIGAMIVAPLMTPILGTMLATVLGDRTNLIRSLVLVLGGAAAAVVIGFAVGLLVPTEVLASTNGQVSARVSPRLIDLLAALGTGVVGSVALVRRDISDTLPGVAIAISLVPPLTVAGLVLESGSVEQFLGALLLFVTNVVAILGTGIVVMSVYGVSRLTRRRVPGDTSAPSLLSAVAVLTVMLLLIGVPLTLTSVEVTARSNVEGTVQTVGTEWARSVGWTVTGVTTRGTDVTLQVQGAPPVPDTAALETALTAAGINPDRVTVDLTPATIVKLSTAP